VGIIGKEGRQAVNNSDFAFGQFRHLRILLFVHGRSNYRRISRFAYHIFYLNVAMPLAMWFYSVFAAFASGGQLLLFFFTNFYTVIYTPLLSIAAGFSDQDVTKAKMRTEPGLYTRGIERLSYTHFGFFLWMSEALWLALVSVGVPILGVSALSYGGPGWPTLGFTTMTIIAVTVNVRIALEIHSWTWIETTVSICTYLVLQLTSILFAYQLSPPIAYMVGVEWNDYIGVIQNNYPEPAFWLTVVWGVLLALLPRLCLKSKHAIDPETIAKRVRRQTREEAAGRSHRRTAKRRQQAEADAEPSESGASARATRAGFDSAVHRAKLRETGGNFAFSQDEKSTKLLLASTKGMGKSVKLAFSLEEDEDADDAVYEAAVANGTGGADTKARPGTVGRWWWR